MTGVARIRAQFIPLSTSAIAVVAGLAILMLLAVLVLEAGIHFLGSDDVTYWSGGQGWLQHFPYVGGLGADRETIAIPLALSATLIGNNLLALVLPTFVYTVGLVVLLMVWTHRVGGPLAAVTTGLLLVTCPLVVAWASVASVDLIEAFFDFGSLFLFYRAVTEGCSWRKLIFSGILLGLGLITRETSIFLVTIYGFLFLFGYGIPRKWYFVIGLGALLIVGLDTAYYAAMTGQPLYRFGVALRHDSTINRWVGQGAGVPLIHPALDPFTMLTTSHYFGLLFYVAIPLTAYGWRWIIRNRQLRVTEQLVGLFTVGWFALAAANVTLLPLLARYFTISAVGACVLAGVGLAALWGAGRRVLAASLLALMLLANVAGISVENRRYMFGEWQLLRTASESPTVVHTDPATFRRAALLLEWHGLYRRVTAEPPSPGDIFFWNALRAETASPPDPNWQELERISPPVPMVRRIAAHLVQLVAPQSLSQKLLIEHPGVVVYQVR